jgi:CPA1 family monovalent cation:H+ antiporter
MTSEIIILSVEVIILLLTIAAVVGIVARRLRMPYTVGLVVVGLLLFITVNWLNLLADYPYLRGIVDLLDELIHLDPDVTREIILGLLVPPLIFEAAFHLRSKDLRRDWKIIASFAIPGVVITTLLVGYGVVIGIGIPFSTAIIFGALISATDPVAVVALFKKLGVPKRLQVLLEGESLFNDGTAIVAFGIALEIAQHKQVTAISIVLDFLIVAGGGILLGFILGWLVSRILNQLNDYLIETALTFVLAYGAYFLGETFHVSGVLAVVTAGLINGNIGPRSMSPTTRIVVENFWEFAAFMSNSLIFLLIGLVVDPVQLFQSWKAILVAIAAVLVARAIVIFGLSAINRSIPRKWQLVIFWGGLRGAIALSLALGLGGYPELRAMAYGVALFTLLVQGISMGWLVDRLKLKHRNPDQELYFLRQSRMVSTQAAQNRIDELRVEAFISENTWEVVSHVLQSEMSQLRTTIKKMLQQKPEIAADELDLAWREALQTERLTINNLFSNGKISEQNFIKIASQIDTALDTDMLEWEDLIKYHEGLQESF